MDWLLTQVLPHRVAQDSTQSRILASLRLGVFALNESPLHLSLICWRTPEKRRPVETTLRLSGTEVSDVASLPETFLMNADFAIAGLCW